MDSYNSGNLIGLGPRHRKPKRKYFAKLLIVLAMILLPIGGYIVYQYLASTQQQASVKPVQSLREVPTPNLDKARVEKWNGITKKVAYLTFEDGPTALTPDILKSLQDQEVKATFFLIGSNIDEQPDVVRSIAMAGHYIGPHSETHDYDTLYKKKQYVPEMLQVQKQIKQLTNHSPLLTRPPYGSTPGINKSIAKEIEQAKLRVWDWSIDSMDWYYKDSAKEVAKTVISRAEDPVEIILLHEQPQTLRALPAIVAGLKKKGYQFSIYDEDFHVPYNFAKFSNL
ncbi:polysaccharide deacetylase [Exiguobacterium sp. Helios]|uniref:polysaccharide deacetylase family protein n=1 Tax=Exiguobacterium sp. Helios TaxID=2735868 RepID=UPI00165DEB19|nr:polysaccharide deacetylase family protein [Exiguobacterium sp. Helios]QNR20153.1 polysaccharide deacetylase [Exiguobacterium sp. Helios]